MNHKFFHMNKNEDGSFIVDSHCHLDRYEHPESVIQRALDARVKTMLSISTSRENFKKVQSLAEAYPEVWATAGVHPCDVAQDGSQEASQEEGGPQDLKRDPGEGLYEWLLACAAHPKVIGFGETGLDQYRQKEGDMALQEKLFCLHIQAAQKAKLPLIVHTRESDELFLTIMGRYSDAERPRGVLHCFTGGSVCAQKAASWGWKISLSGILTYPNAENVREMAAALPLHALLVETDAPWLAPQSQRGRYNEPSFIVHTLEVLAELHQMDLQQMAAITRENFFNLFEKAKP